MKKFLTFLIIFFIPIVILIVLMEVLLRRIPNDYSYKSKYLASHSHEIQTLFLGSSHVFYGVNPELFSKPAFNAAHVSQSISLDYEILKKYDGKWAELKTIFIPIDYFTLFERLETTAEKWRLKNYHIYYNIGLPPIKNQFEITSFRLPANLSRINNYYILKHHDVTCNGKGWGKSYSSNNNQDLTITGPIAAKRHTFNDEENVAYNTKVLRSILEYANTKGIQVIMFTCPAYKTYTENLQANQLSATLTIAKKLAASYSNSRYYNLLLDQSFTREDYHDADHLNELGAKKLTLKLDSLARTCLK